MAVLSRVLIGSQQRVDLPDLLSIDSYTGGDFKYLLKTFVGSTPYILRGFDVIDAPLAIGSASLSIRVADSIVYHPESTAGSFFFGLPEGNTRSAPIVPELRLNATNFLYLVISSNGTSTDTRAFWDTDLNGGEGGEFNQDVNTASVLTVEVGISVSTFPEGTIPLAKVKVGTSFIESITDCRNMLFRLGSGGVDPDPFNTFNFRSEPSADYKRSEPMITVTSSGQATPFAGGDKNIRTFKEWMDVVMTKLLELSGTTYWYQSSSTLSVTNIWDDALGSSIKSKGQWNHDSSTAGRVKWTEDIIYKKINDPRDVIIRSNTAGSNLSNEQILFIEMVRDSIINPLDTQVDFISGQAYINGTIGSFESLTKGDWIKKHDDPDTYHLRVEEFYANTGATGGVATPATAKSIKLSGNYAGTTQSTRARFTKGEYLNTDIKVAYRNDPSFYDMGGNLFWLAIRSDTTQKISSFIPTFFNGTVSATDPDNEKVKLVFPTAHNLVDGDRIYVTNPLIGGQYNGTFEVEVDSTTSVYIEYPGANTKPIDLSVGYAVVTTMARDTDYGYQLESASHGFKSGETVVIADAGLGYNGSYTLHERTSTSFQVPFAYNVGSVTTGTAAVAKVTLRTEFGAINVVQGEQIDINEPDTRNILQYLGMYSLAQTAPDYQIPSSYNTLSGTQNFNSDQEDSITTRVAKLTSMMADRVQDRSLRVINRVTFRNVTSGANQVIAISDDLKVIKYGSVNQTINMPTSFNLAENEAVVATIDRNGSATITPVVQSLGNPNLLSENKLILCSRFTGTDVYLWDGTKIANSSSYTVNNWDDSQNKNITVQDLGGVQYLTTSGEFYYKSTVQNVNILIPGSNKNVVNTAAINALPAWQRTIYEGQSAWVRINRHASKVFNTTSTNALDQDSDIAGIIYITNTNEVPVDQDIVVLYVINYGVMMAPRVEQPVGNIYEENMIGVASPANDNEFAAPLVAPSILSLPLDSRNLNDTKLYIVGSGQLEVFLNGQRIRNGDDYIEVGATGDTSTQVQMQINLVLGDILMFRIAGAGAVYFMPAPAQTISLQAGYNNGNTILTESGRPVVISGPAGEKIAVFDGDIECTGVIDPKGLELLPQASSPLNPTHNGIWLDDDLHLHIQTPGGTSTDIDVTDNFENPSHFIGAGDGIKYTGSTLHVDLATGGGLEIVSGQLKLIDTIDNGFDDPMTSPGDIIYRSTGNITTRLPAGGVGTVLTVTGAGAIGWASPTTSQQTTQLENNSGSTINSLVPVRINTSGDMAVVDVSIEAQAMSVVGLTLASVNHGNIGLIVTSGTVYNIGGSWGYGDVLYINKNGTLTNIKPDIGLGSPAFAIGDFIVRIGVVSRQPGSPTQKNLILQVQVLGQL